MVEKVRHFTLLDADNDKLDLMELNHFGYSPEGLGVDMDFTYLSTAGSYLQLTTGIKQNEISLNVIYGYGTNKPYKDFQDVIRFLNKVPLTLTYAFPDQEGDEPYKRDVDIASISKTELDSTHGYLTSALKLNATSPWYRYTKFESSEGDFPTVPPKGYFNGGWKTHGETGYSTGQYSAVPRGYTRTYTENFQKDAIVIPPSGSTSDWYGPVVGYISRDAYSVTGGLYFKFQVISDASNQSITRKVGLSVSNPDFSNPKSVLTNGTTPAPSDAVDLNLRIDLTSMTPNVLLPVRIMVAGGAALTNYESFIIPKVTATVDDIDLANTKVAEATWIPAGKPIYGDTSQPLFSYGYSYIYQTDPSEVKSFIEISNNSLYLGAIEDSPLRVELKATSKTGTITNPGWVLYQAGTNKEIQRERILTTIPEGARLVVNSDYKDREVNIYYDDANQTVHDVAAMMDPTVKGFVRVPPGEYRLELDSATLAQVGSSGFASGSALAYLKEEWLVV